MNGSRPFLVLTLTHVSPLIWYHLLGQSVQRGACDLGPDTQHEFSWSNNWFRDGYISKLVPSAHWWERQRNHMQVRGPSMHQWEAEQSGLHRGWSSFLKPSPELAPTLELKCMVQELTSAEWVSYCSHLQSLNLHFSVWRKLIGRTWLLQTAFKGQSAFCGGGISNGYKETSWTLI